MDRKTHVNNLAYEGYEVFSDKTEIQNYRKSKLEDIQSKVNKVKNMFDGKINVLDVGSGNSKFLYALNEIGMLNQGYGIELSESRHKFAEEWKEDLGIDNVTNINDDVFNCDLTSLPKFDLVLCADLVFQFFEPINEGDSYKFLFNIYNRMNQGGAVILELDDHNKILKCMHDGEAKIWQEFPKPDPWRYLLWDCEYKDSCITLNKTFVNRTTPEIYKSSVVLRNYTREESIDLLKSCKFGDVESFEYFDKPSDLLEDEFITIGRKND
jgi:2-polyprenyl-3-methyl-5-hydroxy-6-metoxy-1,4-benzoquinol methylase